MRIVSSDKGCVEYRKRMVRSAKIFVPEHVLSEMTDHAQAGLDEESEVIGLIIGEVYEDDGGKYAIIHRTTTSVLLADSRHAEFDERFFDEMFASMEFVGRECVVGWYHSHLDLCCYMSPVDVRTQDGIFSGEFGFAIVIDPVRRELKVFDTTIGDPQPIDMVIMEAD